MSASRIPYPVQIAGIAAAYYLAAKLGLELAFATPSVTAIWAPTGIALAAVVLLGYRVWPGVALGALLANAWTDVAFGSVLGITAGNTLEALAGGYLLQRLGGFRPTLDRVRDVLALVVFGAVASTMISATIGTTSLLAGDEIAGPEYGSAWRTWWLGDMGGDLVVAPALMVAVTQWPYARVPGRLVEAGLLVLSTIAVGLFTFSQDLSLTFLAFPPMIWAALRFWQPGAAGTTLLLAAIAIPLTENDIGPFAGESPDDRLLLAQTFLGISGISALILAAVVTGRWRAERAAEHIANTLQESLMPAHPPQVPGLELAVEFKAAGERHLVGGDFYDLFGTEGGEWTLVVGDVRGKGADAAALTGLARYTVRAAAVDERSPARILGLLNDALRRQAPRELCTVACAQLDATAGDVARLVLASGGHPLPLVLRADGSVEEVGDHGTLLGATADPTLTDHPIELREGDAILLYTDGITDAYAPGRILSPSTLADLLASCAGRPAAEIVSTIEGAALDPHGDDPRDDILLLALRVPPSCPGDEAVLDI